MSLSELRQHHPRWARFLGLRTGSDPTYLRRNARNLRSLAALGVLVTFITWALPLLITAVDMTGKLQQPHAPGLESMGRLAQGVANAPYGLLQLALSGLPELIATLWLLIGVRKLATALMAADWQWQAVARSFRSISRALTLAAVLAIVTMSIGTQNVTAGSTLMVWNIGLAFGTRAILTVIAAITMAMLTRLLAQAAELADENREFV